MDAKKAALNAGCVVFLLWLVTPVILIALYPKISDRGAFADGYGFITSLFTGITIIGLIYTIYLQRETIIKQDQENDLRKFEDRFFMLIRLHSDMVNSLDYRKKNGTLISSGRDVFQSFYNLVDKQIKKDGEVFIDDPETNIEVAAKVYVDHKSDFDIYFKSLESIVGFLEQNTVKYSIDEYLTVFKSQISNYETTFIHYGAEFKGDYRHKPFKNPEIIKHYLLQDIEKAYIQFGWMEKGDSKEELE